jgi:hypothetical protein
MIWTVIFFEEIAGHQQEVHEEQDDGELPGEAEQAEAAGPQIVARGERRLDDLHPRRAAGDRRRVRGLFRCPLDFLGRLLHFLERPFRASSLRFESLREAAGGGRHGVHDRQRLTGERVDP